VEADDQHGRRRGCHQDADAEGRDQPTRVSPEGGTVLAGPRRFPAGGADGIEDLIHSLGAAHIGIERAM
jgi:hypothetical protein